MAGEGVKRSRSGAGLLIAPPLPFGDVLAFMMRDPTTNPSPNLNVEVQYHHCRSARSGITFRKGYHFQAGIDRIA